MSYPFNNVEVIEDTLFIDTGFFRSLFANSERLRVFTVKLTAPRYIWAEVMAHRTNARNAASSRAIPVATQLAKVRNNPVIPISWGRNRAGMQAAEELDCEDARFCEAAWRTAAAHAADAAEVLMRVGVHKQVANRLLEPFLPIQAVMTWAVGPDAPPQYSGLLSLFKQRIHTDAQPEFQDLATKLKAAWDKSRPIHQMIGTAGAVHLPFARDLYAPTEQRLRTSVARCARVSYERSGVESTHEADNSLYTRLASADPAHASPFEHQWFYTGRRPETLRQRMGI